MYLYFQIYLKRLIIRNWFTRLQRLVCPKICKVSWQARDTGTGTVPIQVWWPENQKSQCFHCSPVASHSRPKKSQHFSLSPKPGLTSSLLKGGLTFLLSPSTGWMRPTTSGRAICFTQSISSNVNLIPRTHPEYGLTEYLSTPLSIELTHKIKHHTGIINISSINVLSLQFSCDTNSL